MFEEKRERRKLHHGHIGQPLQEGENTLEVVADGVVGHAIVVHNLDSTQLVVWCVNFPAQNLQEEKNKNKKKTVFYIGRIYKTKKTIL